MSGSANLPASVCGNRTLMILHIPNTDLLKQPFGGLRPDRMAEHNGLTLAGIAFDNLEPAIVSPSSGERVHTSPDHIRDNQPNRRAVGDKSARLPQSRPELVFGQRGPHTRAWFARH